MISLDVETKKHAIVNTTRQEALELLRQVDAVALLMPGVDRAEKLAHNRFRCVLKPHVSFGIVFQGSYVCEYQDNDLDEVSWTSLEGNMRSQGAWKISGRDGAIVLSLRVATELELPLPRIMRYPALVYAELYVSRGVDSQLATIRSRLEGSCASFKSGSIELAS